MSPTFRGPVALCAPAALLLALAPTASAQSPLTRLQRGTLEYAGTNYAIQSAVLSADGKYVAFEATATNITNPDNNGKSDVFLVETDTSYVHLVSHIPGVSGGVGTFVNALPGDGDSVSPSISRDGRWVAFASDATDLLGPGGDTNGVRDVFLFDRDAPQGQSVVRISAPTPGGQTTGASDHPSVDDSGDLIAFESAASELFPFPPPQNTPQVFLVDRSNSSWNVQLLSIGTAGTPPSGPSTLPVISATGGFVAFQSQATNLHPLDGNGAFMDVFVADVSTSLVVLASRDPFAPTHLARPSGSPSISPNGRYVAFESTAENLAGGAEINIDWDIFVSDWDGTTANLVLPLSRLTNGSGGTEAAGDSRYPRVSRGFSGPDGQFVVFESSANNLDGPMGTGFGLNAQLEVFGVDRTTLQTTLLSSSTVGLATTDCTSASIGSGLSRVSFISIDDNLALPMETTTGDPDVFLNWIPDQGPVVYCQPSVSWWGCGSSAQPINLLFSGTPSDSSPNPFTVTATGVRGSTSGQFFYSLLGPNNVPLQNNGYLCVTSPTQRLPVQSTGGGPNNTCTGSLFVDMNAVIQNPSYLGLDPGAQVWLQGWYRDAVSKEAFTQAAYFVIQP